jgi:hypothetical protein
MVCRTCGQVNADGIQFCANPSCGEYLGWETQVPHAAPAPVRGGATIRAAVPVQHAAATVTMSTSDLSVDPGGIASTTVSVHNGGTQIEEFQMTVLGPAAGWAIVEPARLSIYPGERAEATVRFAPPKHYTTAPGPAWFGVRAMSTLHPSLFSTADGTLRIGTFRDFTATMVPQHTTGRWRSTHRIDMTNTGNVVEPVRIQAIDPAARIRFGVPQGDIPLGPGQHSVEMTVTPSRRWLGRPERHPFQVMVHTPPPSTAVRLDGTREVVPMIAGWVPKLALALAGLLVLGGIALLLKAGPLKGNLTGGTPTIGPTATNPQTPVTVPTNTGKPASKPATSTPATTKPVTVNGHEYMAWRGTGNDNRLWFSTFDSQKGWSGQQPVPGAASNTTPTLGLSNNKLILSWRGANDDSHIWWASFDGTKWTNPQSLDDRRTDTEPALATVSGVLYMIWLGTAGDTNLWYSTFDGTAWSNQQTLTDMGAASNPAVASNGSALYVAWRGAGDDSHIWWETLDGQQWSGAQSLDDRRTDRMPALGTAGGKVYMTWRGVADDTQIYWSMFDGVKWTDQQGVPDTQTNTGPALGDVGGKLFLAYSNAGDDEHIWWETYDGTQWSGGQRLDDRKTATNPALLGNQS